METQKLTTGKQSLNYGLLLGAVGVAFNFMLYTVDAHTTQSPVIQIVNIAISVAIIFWGILGFKKVNGGFLKMSEALKLGTGMSLIAGILQIGYTLLLVNVLDTGFVRRVIELRIAEAAQQNGMTPEQIEQGIEMGIKFFWFGYPVMLIVSVIFGLIIGLVGGLIFKKSPEA
ncbi:DUF4199 domain-containing protein [Robiginitalea sp.]|nr:DUF4199 domain-containing protein [Robiginitalea sp.]